MLKKSVALILSLLLIMQILPMSVFAEEAAEADDASAEIIAEETETEEEASIIAEDEAKRDENTKHYLLSDGSYNAVVYPVPIHYQKDGETEWDEIDNTLIEVSDENENEYFIPEASPIDVKFAKYGDSDNLVRYKVNGYEISWSYEDGDFGLFQKHSKMSKNSKKKAKINNDAKIPTDVLENIESSAQYDHFYDNVDIEYTVTSEGVKENIILNKKSAQNVFYIKYNIGKLTAKQTNERLITLYDGENAVVQIDAPYMTDAADVSSDAISFEIVEQNNGALRVCLTADSEWLNAEDREYPVTIDPYIFEFNEDIDNDVSYLQYSSGDKPIGTVPVGRNHAYGACRGYIKFQLPSLSAGDMVTGGTLNVYQFKGTKGFSADPASITSIRVNVSLVTTAWDESIAVESVIVGTVPTYSSIVLDTMEIGTVSTATLRTFNVGTAIRTWYNKPDENYGLCLYSPTQYSSYIYAGFAATDHDDGSHPPILAISYLNNKGLEDRWTYHTQSLGESGTSYVNDCTGNLVFVAPVCNTVGNNAPISVNLVYNGYLVNSSGTNIGKCGPGWRFDFQQQITPIASGTALYTSGFRYIYTDADGTDHYFKEKTDETNTYEDEEGLGLTLKVGSDGDAKYTLEFKSGAKNIYNANGNIVKICDADNNYYKYTYNSSNQLSYITDGFDRKLTFTYTSAGYFSTITDAAGRVTKLSYASPAKISKITYPDGAYTSFTYDSSNRLTKCTAIDGTSIVYGYPVSDYNTVKNRVTSVKELGTSGLEGNSLSISYAYNNYTVFSDNRNHTEKYVFDEYGRTVCIFDAAENGIKYSYTSAVSATEDDSTKDNNKLLSTAVKTRYVDNLLKNHSFENGTTNWYVYGTNSATATTSTSTPMLGNKAMTFNNTAAGSTTAYQKIYLSSGLITEGYIYTFSAYVKANSADSNAYMFINCVDTSTGSSVSVGSVSSAKITEITDGYKRISIYMQVPAGTDYVNFAVSASGVGITQFDCLQVEAGSIMNDYNLLENSSFEDSSSTAWTGINLGTNDGRKEDSNGGGYYQLYGDINTDKGVYQNIVINKPATDCAFSVSGYASANSLPIITYRYFSINIKLIYSDGTTEFQNIPFEPSVTTTQYTTGIIKPFKDYRTKTLSTVQIRLIYYRNMNSVVFNNLSVNFDETGTSYTYDIEGNVTSAADNANTNRTFTYDSANNLLTSSYEDNTKYTYEYYDGIENTHRLESATSSKSGIKMSYAYNPYGGVSSVTVSKDGYAKSITTSTEYSTRGNYVTAETDALGNRTVYTYNDNEGTLATVKDAAGNVTSYTYNANNDYLTKVSANIDGLTSQPSVAYGYNSRRLLTKISTNSLSYNFKYDEYNNLQSVYIGTSIQLIKNTYASNNGNLTESEYANEDKVKYTYDALDRVTEVEYTNDDDVRYTRYTNTYNGKNQLVCTNNGSEGYTTYYTYDLSGRLLEKKRSDDAYIRTAYDTRNLATGLTYSFGGLTEKMSYTYSESMDNALGKTTFTNNSFSEISYDELGRKTADTIKNYASTQLFKTEYEYLDKSSTQTSGMVSGISYSNTAIDDIEYTYDSRGNIKLISYDNGITFERFIYDELNRLIRVDSELTNETVVYTYSNSGNITKKAIYACGAYDSALTEKVLKSTVTYTYDTGDWKDKLTAYNGTDITYDALGNPLTYGNNSFTWYGRRMASFSDGTTTTSYKYDENGIRTSKTVGSTKTSFLLDGSTILSQKTGSVVNSFYYDGNGKRIAFKHNGYMYFYVYNLQGDVTHLLDSAGNVVGTYRYDAWGKITNLSSLTSIAKQNPFRYRGYYYDTESGLYYLNSRYYNPEWGRFISADGYVTTGQGLTSYNMFVYCGNNPVNMFDPTGDIGIMVTLSGIAVWKLAVTLIGAIATIIMVGTVAKNPPALPPIYIPQIEIKQKAEAKTKTKDIAPTLPKSSSKDPTHHIVAKADYRAEESRQILRDVGIEPTTDPRNLVVLPQSYHASLHTTAYHNYVTERLRAVAGDKAEVEATLDSLRTEILARSAAGIRWD